MFKSANFAGFAALASLAPTVPAHAQAREEPVLTQTPDAEDVAMTPVKDLNLKKDEIPSVLLAAAADPYASASIRKCEDIVAALAPLDAALGPDMDVAEVDGERISAGAVAKSVVASFIPFRGVIRELTGAADHQREFQAAIYAGAVRRAFLKGLGQQMKCPYPARPAFAKVAAPSAPAKGGKGVAPIAASAGGATQFVSQPVVQGEPQRRR